MKRDSLPSGHELRGVLGENPFLEALGPYITYADIATQLAHSPLNSISLDDIPLAHRESLLALGKQHFVPTQLAQNIAAALQSLLHDHYVHRNPLDANVRKKIGEITGFRNQEITALPWYPNSASGAIIKGITGTGKTTIVDRYLSILPYQVREYVNGEVPGFHLIRQIVWMKVDMSADGSRGGFLLAILAEVDRLVDTDYYLQYERTKLSIEKLMVRVGIILSTHFTGVLIIEEIQLENFSETKHLKELATFFLRLLNFGIPVVLIGNPLGFDELENHSQLMRRLSLGGVFELHPYGSINDFDWSEFLVPELWEFNVMPKSTELSDEIRHKFYERSGGIPDYLARLRFESQRIALRCGRDEVNVNDIEKAFHGPTIKGNHDLINGFARKDINLLSKFKDVPIDLYRRIWEREAENNSKETNGHEASPTPKRESFTIPAQESASNMQKNIKKANFKREETRAINREKKVRSLNSSLPENDMRRDGAKCSLIAKFEDLKEGIKNKD